MRVRSENHCYRVVLVIYKFIFVRTFSTYIFVSFNEQKLHLNVYSALYLYILCICVYSNKHNTHTRILIYTYTYIFAFIHAHSISLLRVEIKRGGNFKKSRVVIEWKGKEESNLWVYISCWLPRLMAHSFSTPGLKVFPFFFFFPEVFFFYSFAKPFSLLPPTYHRRPMHSGWIEIPIEPFNPLSAGQI